MKRFKFFVKYYIFWVLLSIVAKAIFLLWNLGETSDLTGGEIFGVFLHGIRMDLSLAGYMGLLTAFVMFFSGLLRASVIRVVMDCITALFLTIFTIIMVVDMELFANWGFHLDLTPMAYLNTPATATASTPGWLVAILLAIMVLFWLAAWYCYRHFVRYPDEEGHPLRQLLLYILLGGIVFIPTRGGFNRAPMNTGFCYFHPTKNYANQAAVNPAWNFMYEAVHSGRNRRVWNFMPEERALAIVDSLCYSSDTFEKILSIERPNIVLLLMESFTSNAIAPLGGYSDVTPELNELVKEGVLFYNIYGSAQRSDRGIAAVTSGWPSHPNVAAVHYPERMRDNPSIPSVLRDTGYTTAFYYAGDLNFGNFRSYTRQIFDTLVDENDFSGEAVRTRFKWGIHDEYSYARFAEDLVKARESGREPFFYMIFNLSSHEPFTVPMEHKFPGEAREDKFKSAIYYTDSCLGELIRECKRNGIWDSTLFVLVADHGTRVVGGSHEAVDPLTYKIPILFTGGAVAVRDTVIYNIGSQIDLASTLLNQLGLDASGFRYSKNLLADSVTQFAFFSIPQSAGVVSEEGSAVMDLKGETWIEAYTTNEEDKESVKAWLQVVDAITSH